MKLQSKPNIVFILTDQMRGDCLGAPGHPTVRTPHLDELARRGTLFTAAYSPCPSCVAARASLFTGQRPTTHGRLGYQDRVPWKYKDTLAEVLSRSGYQTHCVGKTHFFPQRLPLGFETQDSYEGLQRHTPGYVNDYFEWLKEHTDVQERDHGLGSNSWVGGASLLPAHLHNNSWVVTRGIEFLNRRDRHRPFFLNLSFHRPHPPLDPPQESLDEYKGCDIPAAPVGEWADRYDQPVTSNNAWFGHLTPDLLADSRRSYFAQITHIDAQIGRFIEACASLAPEQTWFIFTSDHGEMLGDHHLFRKTYAYEGSARIPMIIAPPDGARQRISDAPVTLEDVMPTILDAANIDCPNSVEGKSMLPLLSTPHTGTNWRPYTHGEHAKCYHQDNAMQFLTDGKTKYIWFTLSGEEQLFNLVDDPNEIHNLATDPAHNDQLLLWRSRLIHELSPRTEDGLTDGKQLIPGTLLPAVRNHLKQQTDGE